MVQQNKNAEDHQASYGRDQVVSIINSVLHKIHEPNELSRDNLKKELNGLKEIIENLRQQLQDSQPGDIRNMHIPSAADELEAIVSTTEEATETIMESCETIMESVKEADEKIQHDVESNIVRIYEACTFQDLTGQRIKKVSTSLAQIDEKVSSIIGMLSEKLVHIPHDAAKTAAKPPPDPSDHDSLLNGPALPQDAVSQDDIDKILAELENGG